jgi:hypothetical protein
MLQADQADCLPGYSRTEPQTLMLVAVPSERIPSRNNLSWADVTFVRDLES